LTFTFQVRVYYEDTDAAGVVYYASYLRFMERARTEWLDWLGMPLCELERDHGVTFAVHRAEIDFRQPAILNDRLDVTVEALDRRACSLNVAQRVLRAATPLASARIALACLDRARWRPARIPRALLERLDVQQTSDANSLNSA
jgi:acyl-CoA thioester hydrolase